MIDAFLPKFEAFFEKLKYIVRHDKLKPDSFCEDSRKPGNSIRVYGWVKLHTQRVMMIYRAFVLAAFSTIAVAANANLVNNGSFELGTFTGSGGFQTLGASNSTITGWTANNIDWIGTYWTAQDGSKSVDLNSLQTGSIEQSFGTTAGVQYVVDFYLSGNNAGLPAVKSLDVTADGATFSDTFNTTGNSLSNMGWVKKSFTFTADDATATLKFASTNSGSFGPAIDNVSVQAVPEPASFAVLSIGLLALKRRRASK